MQQATAASDLPIRRGGSWGIWHVVDGETRIPLCGSRNRLDPKVYSASMTFLRERPGRLCGTCERRSGVKE